ncbi:MAG: antitermination protein NusG [Bacteroidota bacterium]|nr:antitermination protein NusG [Bacteroidota bacterium]
MKVTHVMEWYVLYTRKNCERKTTEFLSRKKFEFFCPLNLVTPVSSEWKKSDLRPLFPSYVFVRLPQPEFLKYQYSDGILSFLYWLDKPAVIPREEIEAIQNFVERYQGIRVEKIPVNQETPLKIVNGLFVEQQGTAQQKENKRIKIYLPALGYALSAQVVTRFGEVKSIGTYPENSPQETQFHRTQINPL